MKVILGILFFAVALILCTILAKPIHQKRIELDLRHKVSEVLKEHDLDSTNVEVTHHHLTHIAELPATASAREDLANDLDGIIGLYVDLDSISTSSESLPEEVTPVVSSPELAAPNFRLAEQADQSVILSGLIRDEDERDFLVVLAAAPATDGGPLRRVVDQLELSDKVAAIGPKKQLSTFAPDVLSSADEGFVDWRPSELVVGGLVESEEQQSTLLANAAELTGEDAIPSNKLKIQEFEDLDFGLERKEEAIVVTGRLPDTGTRNQLLKIVASEANNTLVIDKTSIASESREGWWAKEPEAFIPDFLSKTKGPARLHYYHDRFVAEGSFSKESDYKLAQKKIAQFPAETKLETKLSFTGELMPEPSGPAPAADLIKELKALAVYFNSSSSWVKDSENGKIDEAAKLILASEDVAVGLTVGGYADLRGNAKSNRALSLERAKAVRDRLIAKGVPADRLTLNHFGEDTSKTAKKDLWKSRRVEISLTKASDQ